MELIAVALLCFGLGILYKSSEGKNKFDLQIMEYLKLGKRVIICVDDEATIMERIDNKIRITKAVMNFTMESVDAPTVDSINSSESSYPGPSDLPH